MVNKLLYIFIAVTYFIKKRMLNDADKDNIKYMVNSNHLWWNSNQCRTDFGLVVWNLNQS